MSAASNSMLVSCFHRYIPPSPPLDFEKLLCDVLLKHGYAESQIAGLRAPLRALGALRAQCGPPSGQPHRDTLYKYFNYLCRFEAFCAPLGALVLEARLPFQWTDTLTKEQAPPGDLAYEKASVMWQIMASEAKEALREDLAGDKQAKLRAKCASMKRAWGTCNALMEQVRQCVAGGR